MNKKTKYQFIGLCPNPQSSTIYTDKEQLNKLYNNKQKKVDDNNGKN